MAEPSYRLAGLKEPFELVAERNGGTTFLRLLGELDLSSEQRFRRELEGLGARPPDRLVIDLSGLDFIDSSGARLILEAMSLRRRGGFDLSFIPGRGQVRRLCEMTGLDRLLPMVEH